MTEEKRQLEVICDGKVIKEIMKQRYTGKYIFRGDVFFADLNPIVGSETGGIRPVVVIQNNMGNKNSPTIIAAVTSQVSRKTLPTHVEVEAATGGLTKGSIIMLEQVRTIDKSRLKKLIGHVDDYTMAKIDNAIKVSLEIEE